MLNWNSAEEIIFYNSNLAERPMAYVIHSPYNI